MGLVGRALREHAPSTGDAKDVRLGELALNFRVKGGGLPRGTLETVLDGFEGKDPPRKEGTPRFYPKEYRNTAKSALGLSQFALPKYQLGQFTAPNFMSVVNVPVLCRAAPSFGFTAGADLRISDKYVAGGRPALLNGYGLFQSTLFIGYLVFGGMALAIPPFRSRLRNWLKTYNYEGSPGGKVYLDARGSSSDGKACATARCSFPGDAGIYATGLFAAGVANSLLEATTTSVDTTHPMPLAGFHSPVVALEGCREGLLVDNLRKMGAQIEVRAASEGGGGGVELDAAKFRSKL